MNSKIKVELFKSLLLTRKFEEKRIDRAEEIAKSDLGPCSCYGQEAIPVGFCFALHEDDYILPSIRSAWAANLTKGLSLSRITAEMYNKVKGTSNSRDTSSHITYPKLGILGGTGLVGSTITVAAGVGLAVKYKNTNQVAICFIGDGTCNREDFHTGLNFAALQKLPVIYVVENNQIAEYTRYDKFMPIEDIADRATAYGIPGEIVDGNDVLAVYEIARETVERARRGKGSSLVECKTCRVRPMSELADPEKGLPKEIIEKWREKDPVKRLKKQLLNNELLSEDEIKGLEMTYEDKVDDAFGFAKECEYPSFEKVFNNVYTEGVLKG